MQRSPLASQGSCHSLHVKVTLKQVQSVCPNSHCETVLTCICWKVGIASCCPFPWIQRAALCVKNVMRQPTPKDTMGTCRQKRHERQFNRETPWASHQSCNLQICCTSFSAIPRLQLKAPTHEQVFTESELSSLRKRAKLKKMFPYTEASQTHKRGNSPSKHIFSQFMGSARLGRRGV